MSSKTEPLDKPATPIYQRNANRRYYEKHRNDPEYKAMLNENSRQWKKDNKEEYNKYMREYRKQKKEEKQIIMQD